MENGRPSCYGSRKCQNNTRAVLGGEYYKDHSSTPTRTHTHARTPHTFGRVCFSQLTKLCGDMKAHLKLSSEDVDQIEAAKAQLQSVLDKRTVRVVTLLGEETEIRMHPTATVADLKKGIERSLGKDTVAQQLVLPDSEEPLVDTELLQENGIFDDSISVTLLIRGKVDVCLFGNFSISPEFLHLFVLHSIHALDLS